MSPFDVLLFRGKLYGETRKHGVSSIKGTTYSCRDDFVACFGQVLDKLGIQLVVSIPRASSKSDGRLETFKHVNLAGNVLITVRAMCDALRANEPAPMAHA